MTFSVNFETSILVLCKTIDLSTNHFHMVYQIYVWFIFIEMRFGDGNAYVLPFSMAILKVSFWSCIRSLDLPANHFHINTNQPLDFQ